MCTGNGSRRLSQPFRESAVASGNEPKPRQVFSHGRPEPSHDLKDCTVLVLLGSPETQLRFMHTTENTVFVSIRRDRGMDSFVLSRRLGANARPLQAPEFPYIEICTAAVLNTMQILERQRQRSHRRRAE